MYWRNYLYYLDFIFFILFLVSAEIVAVKRGTFILYNVFTCFCLK